MESISQLVSESLARNGIQPRFDHLRLEWSRWFPCQSSFDVLLVPAKPGLFALGEEIIAPERVEQGFQPCINDAQTPAALAAEVSRSHTKRMLALFQISEADDLGMTLGRLFLPGNPLSERLASGKCLARFTVIEDREQRSQACSIFQRWLQDSSTASYQDVA